jgi:adenylylsulfate kinase
MTSSPPPASPHACIERDALAYAWPTQGAFNQVIVIENVAAVCSNFRRAGAERLVIAGVVETLADVEAYQRAIPGARTTVCQLVAPERERVARLTAREIGAGLEWHLRRTVELEHILDAARIHEFSVENHARPIRETALEVLARANWPA